MKRTVLFLVLAFATASVAMAAIPSQMLGTAHDLGTGGPATYAATNVDLICVFCHTPHQASAANAQDPLWNHQFPTPTPTYGVYASDTLNASPAEIGAAPGTAAVSMLCMSCHDGTVGVGSLYNDPNIAQPDNSGTTITGTANLGTSLVDDHPVNFTFDAALATEDTELETPVSTAWVDAANLVPLFNGTVQCASCHDPHDATNTPFLVRANNNSELCVTCHSK